MKVGLEMMWVLGRAVCGMEDVFCGGEVHV